MTFKSYKLSNLVPTGDTVDIFGNKIDRMAMHNRQRELARQMQAARKAREEKQNKL